MAINYPVMSNNRKVVKYICKALFLRHKIFLLSRTDVDFTLLTVIFIKNSLLISLFKGNSPYHQTGRDWRVNCARMTAI